MHDYKMRIGHSLLWSHEFSRYYTTRGLFKRLCTYMYFVETYSSSLIRNTPRWGWFCTVRRLPSKSAWSAQRVNMLHVQSCVTKLRYKATFLASSNWAFLPSKGRHCLGKAEIRFRETAEPAVSLPSQSSKVGSAYEAGHVELKTHLVASQTFDATRWTSREHLNLHLKSDSEMAQFTWWGSMVQSSTSRAQGLATRP